ncbi:MAG: hypothetical protein ACFFAO_06870 [Candidatus Hermodarchaeota archaeon]
MTDKDQIFENYVEPDATIEYFFLEKSEEHVRCVDNNRGYLYGFINISFSGEFKNDNVTSFRELIEDELNFCIKENEYFVSENIDFNDYKFGIVDNYENITEYEIMDEIFFSDLIKSLRNLLIVGKNYDWEEIKRHNIFHEWFEKYTNRF